MLDKSLLFMDLRFSRYFAWSILGSLAFSFVFLSEPKTKLFRENCADSIAFFSCKVQQIQIIRTREKGEKVFLLIHKVFIKEIWYLIIGWVWLHNNLPKEEPNLSLHRPPIKVIERVTNLYNSLIFNSGMYQFCQAWSQLPKVTLTVTTKCHFIYWHPT